MLPPTEIKRLLGTVNALPIPAGQKYPAAKNWQAREFTRRELEAAANYGIHLIELVVIDIDNGEAYENVLETLKLSDGDTMTVKTRRGYHLYLRGEHKPMSFDWGEVKSGRGHQVVGPGSNHPDGGRYELLHSVPPLDVTAAHLLNGSQRPTEASRRPLADVRVGDRDNRIHALARALANEGVPPEIGEEFLLVANQLFDNPLAEKDVRGKAEYAYRYVHAEEIEKIKAWTPREDILPSWEEFVRDSRNTSPAETIPIVVGDDGEQILPVGTRAMIHAKPEQGKSMAGLALATHAVGPVIWIDADAAGDSRMGQFAIPNRKLFLHTGIEAYDNVDRIAAIVAQHEQPALVILDSLSALNWPMDGGNSQARVNQYIRPWESALGEKVTILMIAHEKYKDEDDGRDRPIGSITTRGSYSLGWKCRSEWAAGKIHRIRLKPTKTRDLDVSPSAGVDIRITDNGIKKPKLDVRAGREKDMRALVEVSDHDERVRAAILEHLAKGPVGKGGIGALGEAIRTRKTTVTRVFNDLAREGLVDRRQAPGKGNRTILCLTGAPNTPSKK